MICLTFCVACGSSNPDHLQHHYLIPRVYGGSDDETNLITLCGICHGKAHDTKRSNNHRELVKDGMERAKAEGRIGRPAIPDHTRNAIQAAYKAGGRGLRGVATEFGVGVETVRRCLEKGI
jgi:acyl CoA:acetate/3-ketoacid CoA transferase alpha subunit